MFPIAPPLCPTDARPPGSTLCVIGKQRGWGRQSPCGWCPILSNLLPSCPILARLIWFCLIPCSLIALGPARAAADEWADVRTVGPLVIRAEFSLTPWQRLLDDLRSVQDDLTRVLAVPAAKQPIEVYLFQGEASYTAYLRQYLPQVPYRRALYVRGQGPGMVFAYQSKRLPEDLRHECTHAMLHAVLPDVPLWLDEGLAEYFEQPIEHRAYDCPHLAAVKRRAWWAMAPDLNDLERRTSPEEMGKAQYRDAWAIVHFALHGPPEARRELRAYLSDLASGAPPEPLSARWQRHWPDVSTALRRHYNGWQRPN